MAFLISNLYQLNYKVYKVDGGYTAVSVELPEVRHVVSSKAEVLKTIDDAMHQGLWLRMQEWKDLPGSFERDSYRLWNPSFSINLKLRLYDLVVSMPVKERVKWVAKVTAGYLSDRIGVGLFLDIVNPTYEYYLVEVIHLLSTLGYCAIAVDARPSRVRD